MQAGSNEKDNRGGRFAENGVDMELEARSPWAAHTGTKEVELHPPLVPPNGQIAIPGSKSYTNRALLIAALAKGTSTIANILRSDDSYWCLEVLQKLGVKLQIEGNTVTIEGTGGNWSNLGASLYIGSAGTIARFLPGVLAVCGSGSWLIEGSRRLSERPLRPLVDALGQWGADIQYTEVPGHLPIKLTAQGLRGGVTDISGAVSSQFISGLLIAGPYARQETEIRITDHIVQHAYVKMTVDLMERFGVTVVHDEKMSRFAVQPQHYTAQSIALEADASTSCYALAYAAITNGYVCITNLSRDTRQPDIGMLGLLERMGCRIISEGADSVVLLGTPQLKGGFTVSMKEMSDQTLTLAALAPFADAPITITGVEHIRTHECDRIRAMCESLGRLGITVEEHDDGLTIHPGTPQPALLSTYDDHRMAMSLALIGSKAYGIRLRDPGCVSKTYPSYFEDMQQLGLRVSFS